MKKIQITFIITIIFLIFYFFGIPLIANPEYHKEFIVSAVKKELGIDIDYKKSKLKMGIIPSFTLEAENFSASDENLYIEKPKINIRIIPLMFKKVVIKNFSCENIKANLMLDENKNFYIGNYKVKPIDNALITEIYKTKIYNYNIFFNDKFNRNNIKIIGKDLAFKKNGEINFSTIGDITINGKKSGIHLIMNIPNENVVDNLVLKGYITDFNLSSISPYVSFLTKGLIENVSGIINMEATESSGKISSEKFSLKIKNIEKPIYLTDKALIDTKLKVSNNIVEISELNVLSKGINVSLNGIVSDIKSKFPKYDINITVKDTLSEKVIPLIPYENFPECEINLKKLRDYKIYSLVNGKLNIKGDNLQPSLNGSFTATDMYVQKPLNIPKATIKLDFKNDKVYFDTFAPASNSQHVIVKGDVELYNDKIADIDIESTSAVDLKTAQIILNPLHEILDFEIGPVPIMDIKGIGNIKLKVHGNKKDPHLFGAFNFKNGIVSFNGVNALIKNGSGRLDFQDTNMHFTTHHATLNNIPIKIEGDCSTKGVLNFDVISNGQYLNSLLTILNTSEMLKDLNKYTILMKAASGKANVNINLKGQMLHIADFEFGKNVIPSGSIKLLNNNVIIGNSVFVLKNIFGNIDFQNKDVDFNLSPLINGQRINLKGKIKDDKIYSKNRLNNINLKLMDSDILIKNGNLDINGDRIIFNKINTEIDSEPAIIDGDITDIFSVPKFDLYISSIPTQKFLDKYLNNKMIYPVILKGNMDYFARLQGTLNSVNVRGTVNMQKNSSIYYKGAIIEANDNPLKLNLDLTASKNDCLIRNFQYNYLDENNKAVPMLRATGKIKNYMKHPNFENFKIKTQNPTDARIFNIIFKKPIIKEGLFTSDLTLNGDFYIPSVNGKFNIFGINAPFLDTTIHDINLNFRNKVADIKLKGEMFSNEITLDANIKNSLKPPYVVNNADLYLGNFNVNAMLKHLDKMNLETFDQIESTEEPETDFDIRNIIIHHLNIKAKSVLVRNLFATDFDAAISMKDGIFDLEKINFITAEGVINGKLNYNFTTSKMLMSLIFDNINANTISEALFDINNQIFGDVNGEVTLSCDGKTHEECMKTINGDCKFSVLNGRMPKLGSLEYLLKSSNVIKSGITGLTLNNLIEILTPLKTGDFESIKGHFSFENGETKDINIASKGKDLSIFISGEYNFASSDTSLEVYGRLAKKISNGLGIVGNVSLNTLFNTIPGINLSKTNQAEFVQIINKIPGIELNTNDFRIFFVKIDGNMNTEDYHQIFKWID